MLNVAHELRISIDILAILVRHCKMEFAHSARSFGNLGDALGNGGRAQVEERREKKIDFQRPLKHRTARQAAWLRKQTRRYRCWKSFSTRSKRRDVLR